MELEWTIVLYLIIIINSFGLAYLVLKSYNSIKYNEKGYKLAQGINVRLSQLKRKVEDIEFYLESGGGGLNKSPAGGDEAKNLTLPDSLDEALKQWDIDSKLIDNPMVKPLAEKIYNQIKTKASSHTEDEDINVGY